MAYETDLDKEIRLFEGWKRAALLVNNQTTADAIQKMIDKLKDRLAKKGTQMSLEQNK